jgi:hypothetical protein
VRAQGPRDHLCAFMVFRIGMSAGAIYIITRDPRYMGLLLNSAASLKRRMPDLPVTVFSEFPLESTLFERVIRVESSLDGFCMPIPIFSIRFRSCSRFLINLTAPPPTKNT